MSGAAPRTTAGGVALFDAAGRILLVHQNYGAYRWDFPGGATEADESPDETAVREAREEIGLDVTIDGLIGVYYTRNVGRLVFIFRASVVGGTLTLQPEELSEADWFVPDVLPPLTTWKARQVADCFAWTGAVFTRTRE